MSVQILKAPIITEKSMRLANEQNVYTFYVDLSANKSQIKKAIAEIYEVKVEKVNTIIEPCQVKRTGKKRMEKLIPRKKKALVRLKKGDTIDLFDIGG